MRLNFCSSSNRSSFVMQKLHDNSQRIMMSRDFLDGFITTGKFLVFFCFFKGGGSGIGGLWKIGEGGGSFFLE